MFLISSIELTTKDSGAAGMAFALYVACATWTNALFGAGQAGLGRGMK
jgi:hypothetical protein